MTPVEYNVRDFGAKGDGATDDSTAFQSAIDEAFTSGGGTVSVPGAPKGWVLAKPILIRPNVTLKGFHAGPSDAHFLAHNDANVASKKNDPLPPVAGGLLIKQNKYPAITLAHNSGIQGLTFVYPDQVPYTSLPIKVYPPTLKLRGVNQGETMPGIPRTHGIKADGPISGRSVTIRDIGAINAYHILDITGDYPITFQMAQITIDGLWGYPLSVGVNIQNSLDTIMLHNVQFRPTFFHPACGEISKSSIGFVIGKSDGCVVSDVLVFGLGIGILHRTIEESYPAFSIRVSNANIEAMLPVWMDSKSVDDQVQYVNSFLFHTQFAFEPSATEVYSREGHALFPDIKYTTKDISVVRISNRYEKQTFQSYARFVGCGFHARGAGPVCRVEGTQLVRVTLASSHMVYFKDAVMQIAPGAKALGIITGNDIMLYGTNLSSAASGNIDLHLVDIDSADTESRVIFSDNMIHGVNPRLVDELSGQKGVTAQGNASL
ncbi:MAG: glycosyl hydrolase family 28-related protein [Armatimonadota bacterium]